MIFISVDFSYPQNTAENKQPQKILVIRYITCTPQLLALLLNILFLYYEGLIYHTILLSGFEHVYCLTMAFTDDLIFTQLRKEDIKLKGC